MKIQLLVLAALAVTPLHAEDTVTLQNLIFTVPTGWTLAQRAANDGTRLFDIAKGNQYITMYARSQSGMALASMYHPKAQQTGDTYSEQYGTLTWQARDTSYSASSGSGATYVHGFLTEFAGHSYYGFSRASSVEEAKSAARELLETMRMQLSAAESLTDEEFGGKKYYFGWGAAGGGDPSSMHNEVKYDVRHTHDIFTKDVGGGYLPTTLFGSAAHESSITREWSALQGKVTAHDMYVQYSSGHGSPSGLGVGVSYQEMRDAALSLPAREVIVFTMACHSGGLVDSFNKKRSEWQSWPGQGRTLFVMASSTVSQSSSTGPGTDPDEPSGPNGSAGSAFGHALWKALIGKADGTFDGVKDGFLSLAEIRDYTTRETKRIGGHTPVSTGAYQESLIMNRVPPRALVEALEREGGTAGLDEAELLMRIQAMDAEG